MSGEWRAGSLADQIAFTKTLLDTHLETKGRVRRVRTPEGARKYGLPIGSIITADALRTVVRAATRRAEQVGGELAPDASAKNDNNDKVAYRIIRQDRDLKGVDLKSGEFTSELLYTEEEMSQLVKDENGTVRRRNMSVGGYRTYDIGGGDGLYARVADEGMTPQQMLALQVMTHEIGHTVGYILQGRVFDVVGGKHSNSSFYGGKDNPDSVTTHHRARMLEILTEYGMFDTKKADKIVSKKVAEHGDGELESLQRQRENLAEMVDNADRYRRVYGDSVYQSMLADRRADVARREKQVADLPAVATRLKQQEWMLISSEGFANADPFNRQAISEHLSEYAATNVSEIMAETWAAYHLQENPGDFVREMGDLMVAALDDYLAETDMTKMPKSRAVVEARKAKGLPTWDNRHIVGMIRGEDFGEGGDIRYKKDTATVRKLLEESQDDPAKMKPTILNASIVKGVNLGGEPDFYSIERSDDTTDPPILVMRKLIPAENGMHIQGITDELVQYNFETDEWERVPA